MTSFVETAESFRGNIGYPHIILFGHKDSENPKFRETCIHPIRPLNPVVHFLMGLIQSINYSFFSSFMFLFLSFTYLYFIFLIFFFDEGGVEKG